MNELRLHIEIKDNETKALFVNIHRVLAPTTLQEFMRVGAARYLRERASARFAGQGDATVGHWAPLHSSTIAIREAKGYPAGPINVRTGELRDKVLGPPKTGVADGGAFMDMPNMEGVSPELLKKFATAQVGSRTAPITTRRPVLAISANDADAILLRFHAWFTTELGRASEVVPV